MSDTSVNNGVPLKMPNGSVTVLLGAQWGDEGKGKIIDFLVEHDKVDVTARCQGGNNAGHTVIANGKKYDFHLLPSGIISDRCQNVIGNGVVVNLDALFEELEHNNIPRDFPGWEKRLVLSNRAHLIFKVHMLVDGRQEESLASKEKIGTTQRGIGPTYSSKCFRNGVRVADLMGDFEEFAKRYRSLVALYKKQFPAVDVNEEEELERLKGHAATLRKLRIVADTPSLLDKIRKQGKTILVEGANGALLDIDFGTYPFVTSSNSTVGGACTGLGLPPTAITEIIGVVKAYQTRVGTGPFPTEDHGEDGTKLQEIGKEWGVTTGRRRRCGWVDLVLLRSASIINGFTSIALTKLDVLDSFKQIKVAVGYTLDGVELTDAPARASDWDRIQVRYETLSGWETSTADIRSYDQLPENCRRYIEFLSKFINVPVKFIGVGASREALIVVR